MTWKEYNAKCAKQLYYRLGKGDMYESPCHSTVFSVSRGTVSTYFSYERVPYSLEEIDNWVQLLNEAGFPMSKIEESDIFVGYDYSKFQNQKFDFKINLNRKDFISSAHYRLGLTLMRMISYHIMHSLENVIPLSIELFKKGEDAYKSICLACKDVVVTGFGDQSAFYICNHNLMGTTQKVQIMTTEEMKVKIKGKSEISSLNK